MSFVTAYERTLNLALEMSPYCESRVVCSADSDRDGWKVELLIEDSWYVAYTAHVRSCISWQDEYNRFCFSPPL